MHWKHFADYRGWFAGFDQRWYLLGARAWAHGNLDPALHHYPPGYSLLAAPFAWLFAPQPFAVPDLLCVIACLWLFAAIARRLTPNGPGWKLAAVASFCLAVLGTPTLRQIWIIPWNSTGAAVFELAAILATLRLAEAPSARRGAVAGAAIGLLAGFRPSDALVLAPCCALFAAFSLPWRRPGWLLRVGLGAAGGLLAALLPFVAAHLAVHGLSPGSYVAGSAALGFEWRLLPMRWVVLVIDPRPLLPTGLGLAEGLPWIVPGLAGIGMLLLGGRQERGWRLVALAMVAHWALYLSYRDMQPYGFWRFYNLHYLKWSFPFLLLAAWRWLAALAAPAGRIPAGLAIVAAILAVGWQIVTIPVSAQIVTESSSLTITADLSQLDEAAFIPMSGAWRDIYFGHAMLAKGDLLFRNTRDFKLQPVPGGVLLQPLRRLPAPPLQFTPAPETRLAAGSLIALRERFRPGLPCGLWPRRGACQPGY